MGSRPFVVALAACMLAVPLFMGATTTGQEAPNGPKLLWETDRSDAGPINGVAIDANGKVAAAVAGDVGPTNTGDNEVFVWDLSGDDPSKDPELADDPQPGMILDGPEGLQVVAVEPAASSKASYIAVGHEGTGDGNRNNLYVYRLRGEPNAAAPDGHSLDGPLRDLWFSENGRRIIAVHDDGLSLLVRASGNEYDQTDTWTTSDGETLVDAAGSRDQGRIVVATRYAPPPGSGSTQTEHRLYILQVNTTGDDPDLQQVSLVKKRPTGSDGFVDVDVDQQGRFAVVGSQETVFYYELMENASKPVDQRLSFSIAWTATAPATVTTVAISGDGLTFVAGFDNDQGRVYRQQTVDEEGPLARRAATFQTGGAPTDARFVNQDTTLMVLGGGLYAFNEVQFSGTGDLEPLWTIPVAHAFDVSRDGHRFIVVKGGDRGVVAAYEQAYTAELGASDNVQVYPGRETSIEVTVSNTGSAFDEYTMSTADVPASWSVSIDPERVSVLPGSERTVSVNVTPGEAAPPGKVPITVTAQSRFAPDEGLAGSQTINLTVPEVHAAALEINGTTVEATRGQVATVSAMLRNAGNVNDTFVIEVDQDRSWDVEIDGRSGDSRETSLDARETAIVAIGVTVPSGATQGSVNELTITARPKDGGTQDELSVTLLVEPDYGVAIAGPTDPVQGEPGDRVTFDVTVRNAGNIEDTLTLRAHSNATNNDLFWEASLSNPSLEVGGGDERTVTVTVNIPRGASAGMGTDVTVTAHSRGSGIQEDAATFTVQVAEEGDDAPLPLVAPLVVAVTAVLARRHRP